MNISGYDNASASVAGTAQRGPTSRAARPAKVSTPAPPSNGAVDKATNVPPSQYAVPSTIGRPAMNCGTIAVPTW